MYILKGIYLLYPRIGVPYFILHPFFLKSVRYTTTVQVLKGTEEQVGLYNRSLTSNCCTANYHITIYNLFFILKEYCSHNIITLD